MRIYALPTHPADAFGSHFFVGLGAGLIIGIYDYLGYITTAYMGDELRDPGRTMPRSIIVSVIAMMFVYLRSQHQRAWRGAVAGHRRNRSRWPRWWWSVAGGMWPRA